MIRFLLLILVPFAVPGVAAPVQLSSPAGVLSVTVDVNGEGRPEYSVSRLGRSVILPSRLGFILAHSKGEPYAVLYMHDGQNLFDRRTAGFGKEWGVDEAVTKLVGEGRMRPAIVVGVWSTPKRLREYVPARAFDRLPPAYMGGVEGLYGGTPLSDRYLRFLVGELKPFVDRSFNVRRDRRATAWRARVDIPLTFLLGREPRS